MKKNKTKIVILAAGKGTRMGGDNPKALSLLKKKTMIEHLLDSVRKSKIDEKPIIIVGYKKELIIKKLGKKYEYITQKKQLGTGHAVKQLKKYIPKNIENIIVLYGDHPFVSKTTIQKIERDHIKYKNKITLATVKLPDYDDWRKNFINFSKIIRNRDGKIIKDVQFKDATLKERKVKEVNPSYYCFDAKWLWQKLNKIKNENAQKEYYLTDLIKIAIDENAPIESISIKPKEALGANSKAELEILENIKV